MTKQTNPEDNQSSDQTEMAAHGQTAETVDLQQQIADLTSALQRERADAENMRRQHSKQLTQLQQVAQTKVIREFLPVIDNIERALSHAPNDAADNDFAKGIAGVAKQFQAVLKKLGVEKIQTVGEQFDPVLHEAVSMDEGEGGQEVVSEELQSGYRMGDDVIRTAMVRVTHQ